MSAPVNIADSKTGITAMVSEFGQLITAPVEYSDPVLVELLTINTAVNIIAPKSGYVIVITGIIASADKNVSNTSPANVDIYTASAPDTITADQDIFRPQLIRAENFPVTGLNIKIPEGKWVNAKTDDAGILVTVMFYRVKKVK